MRPLESPRVRLRAVEPEDGARMFAMETDTEHWCEAGIHAPLSERILREYAENYDADPIRAGQLRLVIEEKPDHSTAGLVDLYEIDAVNRTAKVAIYLTEHHRHRGIAREALDLLHSYASMFLNLRVLCALISSANSASIRTFESASYVWCGKLPGWLLRSNRPHDMLIYAISLT